VQSIDTALTSAHTVHRGDVIAKDWYRGGGLADPLRTQQGKPAERAAEIQRALNRGAGRIRVFDGGGRCPDSQGGGLRHRTKALILALSEPFLRVPGGA
jgi:hypothetical protein